MNPSDQILHVQGKSLYVDDIPHPDGMFFAAVLPSKIAHGKIVNISTQKAEKIPGVEKIFTYKDIPGQNQIGNIIQDEELLAEKEVHYAGQPLALVVATSQRAAKAAVREIEIKYKELRPILDPREAYEEGELIAPVRIFSLGDIKSAWGNCDIIVEGTVESGAQEHVYLETQACLAIPTEHGVKAHSATQAPTVVQKTIAGVLGIPMHAVEVDVRRLGGGFGGKEDQATVWAALASLAAYTTKKAVKLVLQRKEDIQMTGKRHPYSSDFKIGFTTDGKILAYEAFFYQNAGASADLSTSILERSLFHSTNTYFIPNVKITAASCRTNLPPNTAFRGFGAPQAMFVMESAIYAAAEKLGIDPAIIQEKNILKENDQFPYGMKVTNCKALQCWNTAKQKYNVEIIKNHADKFNKSSEFTKKGVAMMPVCFGISFTATFLNQASALVHVYTDGSVQVSTAAVEMGQGVNEKIRQVAATIFSINLDRVRVESTNTTRVANTSPTAASSAADMNGHATRLACLEILGRMKKVAAKKLNVVDAGKICLLDEVVYIENKKTDLKWDELANFMFLERMSLSSQAHYATPNIHFDRKTEKGTPFAYHTFGTAIVEVTLDILRGTYTIDTVRVVHDFGKSLNPLIDRGQLEGAVLQGLGWMTIEEIRHTKEGRIITDTMTTYKVPDIYFAPKEIEVHFLENAENPAGPMGSKAIGEPPFMYGIGAYFAIMNAMKAASKDVQIFFDAPLTPEKVLMSLRATIGSETMTSPI